MPDIQLPDELRFLAAQCSAHVEGHHRDQDRQFIAGLVAQLAILGGEDADHVADILMEEANHFPVEELPDLIRLAATALRHGARMIEREAGKAVAA